MVVPIIVYLVSNVDYVTIGLCRPYIFKFLRSGSNLMISGQNFNETNSRFWLSTFWSIAVLVENLIFLYTVFTYSSPWVQGADSLKKICHLTSIWNPILEIRRSYDRLFIESGPGCLIQKWCVSWSADFSHWAKKISLYVPLLQGLHIRNVLHAWVRPNILFA